jgi:hypothetical protein
MFICDFLFLTKFHIIAHARGRYPALTMKAEDRFSRFDRLGLRPQWTTLPLFDLFSKTICSNSRIKRTRKTKVVATGLAPLNMVAGAQARSRISRLRYCGLITLRHTHVANDVLSRKTRCALRTRAPIGLLTRVL